MSSAAQPSPCPAAGSPIPPRQGQLGTQLLLPGKARRGSPSWTALHTSPELTTQGRPSAEDVPQHSPVVGP